MRQLRYYAPADDRDHHERLLERLDDVAAEHEVAVETVVTAGADGLPDWFDGDAETTEAEVWEAAFAHNRAITANLGERPSSAFKTDDGYAIRGTVAVVDPETGVIHGIRDDAALGFLEAVHDRGPGALADLHEWMDYGYFQDEGMATYYPKERPVIEQIRRIEREQR